MFTGETQSILSTIVNNIAKEDKTGKSHKIIDGKINIERVFPTFPWTRLKDSLINGFAFFGQVCSIAIGLWTIFSLIKNIVNNCVNCFLIRKIGDSIQSTILYFINPNAYFINRLPKKPKDDRGKEENVPLSRETSSSRAINELRLLNESLPAYQA